MTRRNPGPKCHCGSQAVIGLGTCTAHIRIPELDEAGTAVAPFTPTLVMPYPKPRDHGITHDVDFMFAAFLTANPGKWVTYPVAERFAEAGAPLEAAHIARRLKRVQRQISRRSCAYRGGGFRTRIPHAVTLLVRWDPI